jgi:hypothetical protein
MAVTVKEIRKCLKEKLEGIPNKEISAGVYVKTVGTKYLTIINTWETTTQEKIHLSEFDNLKNKSIGECIREYHESQY